MHRLSHYNVFSEIHSNCIACYNTLYGSLILLDAELYKVIKNGKLNVIDKATWQLLENTGIVQRNDIDEMHYYINKRAAAITDSSHLYLFVTLTRICNCACEYCFQGKHNTGKHYYMNDETSRRVRQFIKTVARQNNSNSLQIDWFGGEPFCHFDRLCSEMNYYVNWAFLHNIKTGFRIYTNGTLLNEKRVAELKQFPITDLQITLDGPKHIHDKKRPLKNGKGTYKTIVQNLKLLKLHGIPFVLRINYGKNSASYFEELLDDLKNNYLNDITLYPYAVQAMTHMCGNYNEAVSSDDLLDTLPSLWEAALKKGFKVPLKPLSYYMYCGASRNLSFVVDHRGKVFKCALLQEDDRYQVGHIDSFGRIGEWKTEYNNWFQREPHKFRKCSKCLMLPLCNGGCAGSAVGKYGNYNRPNCYENQLALFKKRLYYYVKYSIPQSLNRQKL